MQNLSNSTHHTCSVANHALPESLQYHPRKYLEQITVGMKFPLWKFLAPMLGSSRAKEPIIFACSFCHLSENLLICMKVCSILRESILSRFVGMKFPLWRFLAPTVLGSSTAKGANYFCMFLLLFVRELAHLHVPFHERLENMNDYFKRQHLYIAAMPVISC